jgi:DNA (cytosine-5)-methyltransferase 1
MTTLDITVSDFFAGAGGSSTGASQVKGVRVTQAANHWKTALDIHNANHQDTDHAHVDLHLERPSFFRRTTIGWFSPECTKWSQANGTNMPAIEEGLFEDPLSDDVKLRSRLLMFDVLKFVEYHRYRLVVVENVVDIATQKKYATAWQVWRQELRALGYTFRVVSLNSMHAQTFGPPAPQSRDRIYIVAWPDGETAPDLDRILRPRAYCPRCDLVAESVQSWKSGRSVGRYRQAYTYNCLTCNRPVEPGWLPAAVAIDWNLQGERIRDREKPLADKTLERIAAGIARYWGPLAVPMEGREGKGATPLDMPMRTQTTRQETALVVNQMSGSDASRSRPSTEPLHTVVSSGNHASLVEQPFMTEYYGTGGARSVDEPLGTQATHQHHGLVMTNQHTNRARPTDESLPTLTTATGGGQAMVQTELPFFAELRGGSSDARSVAEPQSTITAGGNHHALVTGPGEPTCWASRRPRSSACGEPTREDVFNGVYCQCERGEAGVDHRALVQRLNDGGASMTTPADEYLRTLTTGGNVALLQARRQVSLADLAAARELVPEVLFRMLQPHEIAAGMAFPDTYNWQPPDRLRPISNRDLVKAAGNAVTPPAARDLIAAAVASLGHHTESAA